MNIVAFDALTRRASVLALGAAGLGALATTADAKKKKRKRKKKKGDVNKLCKKQVEPCGQILSAENCDPEDAECQAAIETCCEFLGTCNFTELLDCFNAVITPS